MSERRKPTLDSCLQVAIVAVGSVTFLVAGFGMLSRFVSYAQTPSCSGLLAWIALLAVAAVAARAAFEALFRLQSSLGRTSAPHPDQPAQHLADR